MKTRRLAIAVVSLLAATGVSACGNKEDRVDHAKTEGVYVDVGPLKYQVQISRQLNPMNVEDQGYLVGVGPFDRALGNDNIWFAVFIRVENDGDRSAVSAKDFQLTDTQGNTFTPVTLNRANVFAYHPQLVTSHGEFKVNGLNPLPDSAAAEGATGGALLLFKLTHDTLVNRPLRLIIHDPKGSDEATVDLDV